MRPGITALVTIFFLGRKKQIRNGGVPRDSDRVPPLSWLLAVTPVVLLGLEPGHDLSYHTYLWTINLPFNTTLITYEMYWLLVQHFGDYFTIISFKVDQFQIIWNIGGHLGVATRSKRSKTWIFVIFSNYRTPILIWNDPKMYWMVVQHVTQLAFHVYLGNHVSKRPSRGCQMLKIGGKH